MTVMSGLFGCAKEKGLCTKEFVSWPHGALLKVNVLFDTGINEVCNAAFSILSTLKKEK
jgi:hypothetical protein